MVPRKLKFPSGDEPLYQEDEPLDLPVIDLYLPIGADVDAANALTALYRSHCISVIDCFRFCKEKMLWHHFTSFHGTLTVPVQKLLTHPSIAPWIRECDWLMYQKMIRFVAPLALQVVPVKVIDTFSAISSKLGPHISLTFQNHPQHVRDAKLGPATNFAGLLDRLLRVNATAHAAANVLSNDANRDQMWHDWVLHVKPVKVVETCLPMTGYTRVLQILAMDIRDLLGPLTTHSYTGMNHVFQDALNDDSTYKMQHAQSEVGDGSPEGVLDRWTHFLQTLPLRFPRADARMLLHCVNDVSSAALRDITMNEAISFGSWYITKIWVDEMLHWLAEKGGFMEHSPGNMGIREEATLSPEADFDLDELSETLEPSRPRTAASTSIDGMSRLSSIDAGPNGYRGRSQSAKVKARSNSNFETRQISSNYTQQNHGLYEHVDQIGFQPANDMHSANIHELDISPSQLQHDELRRASSAHMLAEGIDDSGIGMGLDDEEPSMAKYGGFVDGVVDGGSDPADVVVC